MATKTEKQQYCNEADLQEDVHALYETGEFPERLGKSLMDMIEGVLHHRRFINYTPDWKDEMRGNALNALMKTLSEKKYDPTVKNTKFFSWATKVVFNQFYDTLRKLRSRTKHMKEYATETQE